MDTQFQALGHDITIQPHQQAPAQTGPIGVDQVRKAAQTLRDYKSGKTALETRIVENDRWYKRRHWEYIRLKQSNPNKVNEVEPTSAWLFNSLANKHADIMDNFPSPNVLPQEKSDEPDATQLSSIIPVILRRNKFEETYSRAAWYKLKNGCVPYGIFWDKSKANGLGDMSIKKLDLLNLFWEPGITDIQDSANFFIISTPDRESFTQQHPELKGKEDTTLTVTEYIHDESIDTSKKIVVVDWYYKRMNPTGRTILHYCQFVGDTALFATENEPENYPNGWYDHSLYPVVFDVLFPEEDMPTGIGYIDICKEPQLYIDKIDQIIMMNALRAGKNRYGVTEGAGVNMDEFTDLSKDVVHFSGSLDDRSFKEMTTKPLDGYIVTHKQMKIDELKETSGNRDFSQGSSSGGVTAAAAISALQEAGNKLSRDMIGGSYRAYTDTVYMVIELDRQFYDEPRNFRIVGEQGEIEYLKYTNERIKRQALPLAYPGQEPAYRVPIFDIIVKPQRQNPFSTNAQNELALNLYKLKFFDPALADQALAALELMSFEGIEKVKQRIAQNGTLFQKLQQMLAIVAKLTGMDTGGDGQDEHPGASGGVASTPKSTDAQTAARATDNATTSYAQKMAAKATPNVNVQSGVKAK